MTSGPGNQLEAPRFRFDVGKAAMIAAGVMVMVSGYTTGKGLLDIVGWGQFYIVVMAALVVQGMLAIAAWFLGQELARYVLRNRLRAGIEPPSAPLTIVTAAVFTATFLASFLFAFSFWYTELRSLSQRTEDARQLPNSFQIAVMKDLRPAVKTARENELKSPEKDPVVAPWLATLTKVDEITRSDARPQVQKTIDANRTREQEAAKAAKDAQTRREASIREARGKIAIAKGQKSNAEQEIEKIKRRLEPFDNELRPLATEWEKNETERLAECGGLEKRQQGCGPKAMKAKLARDAVQRRIDAIEGPIKPDRARLVVLEKEIRDASTTIETQSAVLESLGVTRETGAVASSSPVSAPTPLLENLDQSLELLARRREAFLDKGSPETYQAAADVCMAILRSLSEAKVAVDQLGQLSCESGGVLQLTKTRPARDSARATFDKECSAEQMSDAAASAANMIPHGQQRVSGEILGRSFDHMNAKIQSCINTASVTGADVSAAEETRSRFARLNAPDRDRFQEALNGLWNGGAHRTAAAGIAAIFDLMILALSFFADLFKIRGHIPSRKALVRHPNVDTHPNSLDSIPLAGAKALRRLARYDVATRRSVADLSAPAALNLNSDVLDNLYFRVDTFLEERKADVVEDGRYALSELALGELEAYIEQQQIAPARSPSGGRVGGSEPQVVSTEMPSPARRSQASVPSRPARRAGDLSGTHWPVRRSSMQAKPPQSVRRTETDEAPEAPAQEPERRATGFGIAALMKR